jgi:tetratricopeptide (TPR) repeat protein
MLGSNSGLITAVCAVMLCPGLLAENAEAGWEQHLLEGQDLLKKARFREAEEALLKALAKAERLGTETSAYARTLNNLAYLKMNLGRYAKAERFSRQALQLRERIAGSDNLDVARNLLTSAAVCFCRAGVPKLKLRSYTAERSISTSDRPPRASRYCHGQEEPGRSAGDQTAVCNGRTALHGRFAHI